MGAGGHFSASETGLADNRRRTISSPPRFRNAPVKESHCVDAAGQAISLQELKPFSFIYAVDGALDRDICRSMIARFEGSPEQQYPGRVGPREEHETSIKRSMDLRISGRPDWKDIDGVLFSSLSRALGNLSAIHPFFGANAFRDMGYNMQRTLPGEFYHWHVDSGPGEFSQRQLVALWYLNDVPGPGGETEFFFQQIKVTPREGTLLLFPPFWTHAHRGVTLQQGRKYIATTWVCFADTAARDRRGGQEPSRSRRGMI
jgi:hypothetical protein